MGTGVLNVMAGLASHPEGSKNIPSRLRSSCYRNWDMLHPDGHLARIQSLSLPYQSATTLLKDNGNGFLSSVVTSETQLYHGGTCRNDLSAVRLYKQWSHLNNNARIYLSEARGKM